MYKLGKEGNIYEGLLWVSHFTRAVSFHLHNIAIGYYYFHLACGETKTRTGYLICLDVQFVRD